MTAFISGLLVAGYLVASLYFLRFWRQAKDRLFLLFALAFLLLAALRTLLTLMAGTGYSASLYALRLAAFLLILYAIWDKNRPGRG